jgi:hypothetical protein
MLPREVELTDSAIWQNEKKKSVFGLDLLGDCLFLIPSLYWFFGGRSSKMCYCFRFCAFTFILSFLSFHNWARFGSV